MDIATQAEIFLRQAGYETWTWAPPGSAAAVVCFENVAVMGFVHVFASAEELMTRWKDAQKAVLTRHGAALRAAGAKAWNVYSVFLTEELSPIQQRAVERIEEDFAQTRKIARAGVRTPDDLERALLPLTTIRTQPLTSETAFEDRLRARLKDFPPDVLIAFLGAVPAEEVARILLDKS